MPDRKELGISSQDYEDAVNLEKIYNLVSTNPKCGACRKRKVTHVDLNRIQLVCDSCGKNREDCKPIGAQRISNSDIKKFERRYKRGGSPPAKPYLKEPKNDYKKKSRRPRSEISYSSSEESDEYDEPPPPRYRTHHPKSGLNDNFTPFGEDTPTPGMRNIVMGQQNQQFPPTQYPGQYPPDQTMNFNSLPYPNNYYMNNNPPQTSPQTFNTMNPNTPNYPMMNSSFSPYQGQITTPYQNMYPTQNTMNNSPYGFNTSTQPPPLNSAYPSVNKRIQYPPNSPFVTGQSPFPYTQPNKFVPQNNSGSFTAHTNTPTNYQTQNRAFTPPSSFRVQATPFHTPNTGSRNPFAPQNIYSNRLSTPTQPTPFTGSTMNNNPFSMY